MSQNVTHEQKNNHWITFLRKLLIITFLFFVFRQHEKGGGTGDALEFIPNTFFFRGKIKFNYFTPSDYNNSDIFIIIIIGIKYIWSLDYE